MFSVMFCINSLKLLWRFSNCISIKTSENRWSWPVNSVWHKLWDDLMETNIAWRELIMQFLWQFPTVRSPLARSDVRVCVIYSTESTESYRVSCFRRNFFIERYMGHFFPSLSTNTQIQYTKRDFRHDTPLQHLYNHKSVIRWAVFPTKDCIAIQNSGKHPPQQKQQSGNCFKVVSSSD